MQACGAGLDRQLFFGQGAGDLCAREIVLCACGQEGEDAVDGLVLYHAQDDVELFVVGDLYLTEQLTDAVFVVSDIEDDIGTFMNDLPAAMEARELLYLLQGFFDLLMGEV